MGATLVKVAHVQKCRESEQNVRVAVSSGLQYVRNFIPCLRGINRTLFADRAEKTFRTFPIRRDDESENAHSRCAYL